MLRLENHNDRQQHSNVRLTLARVEFAQVVRFLRNDVGRNEDRTMKSNGFTLRRQLNRRALVVLVGFEHRRLRQRRLFVIEA